MLQVFVIPFLLVAKPSGSYSQLLGTVSRAHSNIMELVEHGVMGPDQILPTARASQDGSPLDHSVPGNEHRLNLESGSSISDHPPDTLAQSKNIDSVSSFTPRTQASYSPTSDDEQFSPPIFTRNTGKGRECYSEKKVNFYFSNISKIICLLFLLCTCSLFYGRQLV